MTAAALQLLQQQIKAFPIHRRWFGLHPTSPSSSPVPISSALPPPPSHPSSSFTVLSYNLLAQGLIRRTFFPYASKQALRVGHRTAQLTAELLSLSPSILALQELDGDLYHQHYQPILSHFGYASVFAHRQGGRHGCGLFYAKTEWSCASYEEVKFDDLALDHPHDPLTQDELRKGNIAQILALQRIPCSPATEATPDLSVPSSTSPLPPVPACGVVVSNTHLHWHPEYRFVRLKQCERLLSAMAETRERLLPGQFHRVFCGDFNVTPITSIYSFLTIATVDPSLWSRFASPLPSAEATVETTEEATVSVPNGSRAREELPQATEDLPNDAAFHARMEEVRKSVLRRAEWPRLHSVYSTYSHIVPEDIRASVLASGAREWSGWTGEPPFTHWVDRYNGTLDYIFTVNENEEDSQASGEEGQGSLHSTLEAVRVLELPTEEMASVQTALPNDVLGSDHVCIGAEFTLTWPQSVTAPQDLSPSREEG